MAILCWIILENCFPETVKTSRGSLQALQALLCVWHWFWHVFKPRHLSTSVSAICSCVDWFGTYLDVVVSFLFYFRSDLQGRLLSSFKIEC